jgi:FkbM family methyltransferase
MTLINRAMSLLPVHARRYYRDVTSRFPAARLRDPESELQATLDMVLSHYRRTNPNVAFLQIGAFDGVTADPLYPLIEPHRLSGYLIEPQQDAFERLRVHYSKFNRPDFTFVRAAMAEHDGTVPLYRVKAGTSGPDWLPRVASLDPNFLHRFSDFVPDVASQIQVDVVPCFTFAKLFSQLAIGYIDLLQIDAEGYDARLLQLFDVPTRRPAIIHFEHKHLGEKVHKESLDLLTSLGYKVAIARDDTLAYRAPEGI